MTLERATREPSVFRFLRFCVQVWVFTTIEVLAALHLGGWLAVGLFLIAAWNVALFLIGLVGVAQMAVAHAKANP